MLVADLLRFGRRQRDFQKRTGRPALTRLMVPAGPADAEFAMPALDSTGSVP